jgi:hypothetical protein
MKKILLSLLLMASFAVFNQSHSQCSGGNVTITNFVVVPAGTQINYSFNWEYVKGNASIQVAFYCNGVEFAALPCIPRLKDSTAGPHTVSGSQPTSCSGVVRMEIRIWANPFCGGTYCSEFRDVQNSPLPVHFSSFTAKRNNSSTVALSWQTASELNNSGFEVQRNVNGNWETVIFVPSQAVGGNSDALLTYHFSDMNSVKGVSQYRIKQIDFDGRSDYSVVRAVRGEGVSVKTIIYPNPSLDGRVNVVFEDANGIRDIVLTDLNGRIVRNWTGVSNNNLTIDNLNPGLYSLRITVRETGAQTVEKLVINKR